MASTSSTKSKRRKKGATPKPIAKPSVAAPIVVARNARISERVWTIGSLSIILVAAFLRLYDLDLVPLHHDEGVNGNFLVRLVREGSYQYDPGNYHGPTLYYFAAIIPWIIRFIFGPAAQNSYGLTTFMIRLMPALFGLGTIWLVLLLRRRIGSLAALVAAGLLAISPGAVYLSRYFIHETLFVFFTIAIVVAALRYYEDGHPVYLIQASISAALLFATKETAFVSAGVLLLAAASTYAYLWLTRRSRGKRGLRRNQQETQSQLFVERAGGPSALLVWGFLALAVFVLVNVLFYSSFFTNYPKGVSDAFKTFEFWTKTGRRDHIHPWSTYVVWLFKQESLLLVLGTVGALLSLWRPKNVFALFCAFWSFGLLAAYSLISYKTPWLLLNFVVPLALIAGFAVQRIYEMEWGGVRAVIMILVIAVGIGAYQTIDLNFVNYDNDSQYYVYVYAHTRRETLKLVDEINRYAQLSPEPATTGITIVSPDYWPLPWYLRDYSRVGYHGSLTNTNEPLIIASEGQRSDVLERFGFRYQLVPSGLNESESFPLRPGVDLILLVRRDLAQPAAKSF